MSVKAILTDIEGTTSSIAFVFEVLFPYAKQHLPAYIRQCAEQDPQSALLQAVRDEAQEPEADVERVIAILAQWMANDVKATSLKALQGLVWFGSKAMPVVKSKGMSIRMLWPHCRCGNNRVFSCMCIHRALYKRKSSFSDIQ